MPLSNEVEANDTIRRLVEGDNTLINKINEIAQDGGRGDHGGTNVNGVYCLHWRSGSYRIFGQFNSGSNKLEVWGIGTHTGKGNAKYKVDWYDGGTYRATTA